LKAVVLAAGKGSRIGSEKEGIPKVLRQLNQKSMIDYVLDQLSFADEIILVVGYKKEEVFEYLGTSHSYAVQDEQLGTGHAVKCASEFFADYDGPVLVTFGDMPLLTSKTYKKALEQYKKSIKDKDPLACILLSNILKDVDLPYGRIIRDKKGKFVKIVEEPDCDEEQKKIREVFFGVMLFNGIKLAKALKMLNNNNAQNEYYLTDLPQIFMDESEKVEVCTVDAQEEIFGINTLEDLKRAEGIIKARKDND